MDLSISQTLPKVKEKPASLRKFSPLLFLSSLGAGGLSVSGFSFINYTLPHGEGLINYSQTHSKNLPVEQSVVYSAMEWEMVITAGIHFALTVILLGWLVSWIKNGGHRELLHDPLRNSALVVPLISLTMTLNVVLATVRYFIPELYQNLQALMLPGLIGWGILWLWIVLFEVQLLKISFERKFDIDRINFSWLQHPFSLSMATVTGTGIAAMAKDASIAHTAAFMALISGTMAIFLLLVKLNSLFHRHFEADGLPEKQFMVSFLVVIPNVTLLSISFFRMGKYMENQLGAHLGQPYFMIVTTLAFAFETWYMLFGLALLKDFFSSSFRKEFFVNQWGLICPLVAYGVLGSFVYTTFVNTPVIFWGVTALIALTSVVYLVLLVRQLRCFGLVKWGVAQCS